MTWVLDRGGTILYKAEWTSAARIGGFLERRRSASGGRAVSGVYVEQLEPVLRDRAEFRRGLERNGPRAVAEFSRAEQIWAERARAAPR
jgi:hypothetical protein